jgi:hypothetical protein
MYSDNEKGAVLINPLPIFNQRADLIFHLVALLETLHPAGGIKDTPFSGIKRMALAAHLNLQLLSGGAGGKSIAAGTDNPGIIEIFGMNLIFHGC